MGNLKQAFFIEFSTIGLIIVLVNKLPKPNNEIFFNKLINSFSPTGASIRLCHYNFTLNTSIQSIYFYNNNLLHSKADKVKLIIIRKFVLTTHTLK